jgi:hypothetical protein
MFNEATIFLPFPVQGTFLEETRLEDQYKSLTLYLQMIAIALLRKYRKWRKWW